MHSRRRHLLGALAIAVGAALTLQACGASSGPGQGAPSASDETAASNGGSATNYPSRQMTYVVPYNPGGSTDPVGREFSRLLGEELGGDFVVQNLPGGDETIGVGSVLKASPDGHTMGLSSATGIIVQPLINKDLPYSGRDAYDPVVKMVEAPNAILVAADSPYQTLDDLIEDARKRPGKVRIGTTGRYTNNSFILVALEEQADVDFTIVPFSGGAGEAVLAALGGQVEAVVPTAAAQLGLIKSGELRALAHTGPTEYGKKFLPGAVALADAGYDVPFSSDYVTITAPGAPEDVRTRLREAAYKVASSEEWAAWCEEKGFLADPMTGDELDAWIEKITEASEKAIELVRAKE